MTRRRVLTLVETLGRGGAERLIVTTMRHLDRDRFVPEVAYLSGPDDLAPDLHALDVPVHRLGFDGPRSIPGAVWRLRGLMERRQVDVLHTHLFFANVVGRLAALGRVPVVTSLHNPDYTYEDNGTLRFRGRKALDRLSRAAAGGTLVAVSEEVRRDYRHHFGWEDIEVILNYLDVEDFRARVDAVDRSAAREGLGIQEEDILVAHVGRFLPQKAHDVLVQAFALAAAEVPELRLVLAGDGRLRDDVEQQVERLGMRDRVRFTGSVADVASLYGASDLFAFPSRFEAFGLALLEAMAAGLPVVATRAGGIPEVVGEAGCLVPVDDAGALAAALVAVARDPARRETLARAASDRALLFDASRWVPRLEAIYADA